MMTTSRPNSDGGGVNAWEVTLLYTLTTERNSAQLKMNAL